MTKEQRKSIIQAITSGKPAQLQQVGDELHKNSISLHNMILSAHFLLEHGRPNGFSELLSYEPACFTSPADVSDLQTALLTYRESGSFARISTPSLDRMLEAIECYRLLKDAERLCELDKYRPLVNLQDNA
jgi:hypothetical protein